MQLKKIKLSGFKSFVDPTTVSLPSNLVAIVGPNGCGKSNIIDAVCWVMGESSAKYLRGESLTDVIFNGSTSRKPVGMASVELVFDNQDGSVGGEYASYAEISIRRQISRDSESGYFLNGVKCRRRDIIDIFLGTGLGPRSYSIIGQNMISRIIEAKPDDMRVYLEEAAGVSKYKERRRETENRINHTKENLARLTDVCLELEKQLNTLKRQSGAAEKFKLLKQEERTLKAQWHTLQWRELDKRLVDESLQIQQQATGLEAKQAEISDINLQLEYRRESQHTTSETFQDVQRRYYALGNDITRLEQDINHHQQRKHEWEADISQTTHDCEEISGNLEQIEDETRELAEDIMHLEPAFEAASEACAEATLQLNHAEEAMHEWQNQWDAFNQQSSKTTQTAQVDQTRIQHLEQRIVSVKQRLAKLDQEKSQFDFSLSETEIDELSEQVNEAREHVAEHTEQLTATREQIVRVQATEQQTNQHLDQVRNELQKLRGQQASLEALQQTALGQRNSQVTEWLTSHQLDKNPRLAQGIEVESGWEQAVEKVLGAHLQAVCVDALSDLTPFVGEFKVGSLSLYSKQHAEQQQALDATTLLAKIKSPWPLESLLSGIYVADSLDDAMSLSAGLKAHESVITRDGVWLGAAWLRVSHADNPEMGVFQREQELKQLACTIGEQVSIHDELQSTLEDLRNQLNALENLRDDLQKKLNISHARSAEVSAQFKMKSERLADLKKRADQFHKDHEENLVQLEESQTELAEVRLSWQQAMAELEQHAGQRDELMELRDQLRDQLQSARQQVSLAKDAMHQIEIRLQTSKSQQAAQQQTLLRMRTQLATLQERKTTLQSELDSLAQTAELEEALSVALTNRLALEEELSEARNAMESVQHEMHALEIKRQAVEREMVHHRDNLETLRVEWQGIKVKSETLLEQLKETGCQIEDVLKELPEHLGVDECHAELEQVTLRISRLGAINLVAIEEYAACLERKQYLDQQNADLIEGLTTLENAIAKIDKETRARFKETFDKVNDRFQEIFPKVFGGGRAYLELTGDNLLDTGVTLMACPPGKRNSTIHLLSGGEKAMTAIALVFSIFHLNPAPFCLLDEVDAPLDDANIGRYCQLVKAMSEKTQFIFISHNKLAIEMGEHLMGVTMHEPGVSRLVSVDINEAVSLAGT